MFGISGAIKGEKGKKTILEIVRARLLKDLLFLSSYLLIFISDSSEVETKIAVYLAEMWERFSKKFL
jgi:hypothetical protein